MFQKSTESCHRSRFGATTVAMKIRRTTSKTSSSPPPTTQHRRRKSAADRITPILPFPSISSPLAHSLPKTFCTPPPPHSLFTAQARVPMVLLHVRTKTSPFCRTNNNTRRVDPVLSCKACDMMIHRSFFKSTNLVSLLVTSRLHFDQTTLFYSRKIDSRVVCFSVCYVVSCFCFE